MNIHEKYIKRCIELAKKGMGRTYPNPMVGCIIVCEGKIIGEGWHQKAGEAHAEVNAINAVEDKELLKKATLYVSLEPCNHVGKTPPCSDLIVYHQIPKVVVGSIDPYDKVTGKGIEKLRKHGCEVIVGVLDDECVALNQRFFTYHTKKRPYIILKWAESVDGFLDADRNVTSKNNAKPNWITNQYSRQLVHKWRAEEQAILVGTNTVLKDNPSLTTRNWFGSNPVRIVLDRLLKVPDDYLVFNDEAKTIVFTEKDSISKAKHIVFQKIDLSENLAQQLCDVLYKYEIQSVIVEGGLQTLQTFIDANFWDEARVFTGAVHFNSGVKAPKISGQLISEQRIQSDVLKIIRKGN